MINLLRDRLPRNEDLRDLGSDGVFFAWLHRILTYIKATRGRQYSFK
jgi:hypothetical protein